MEERKDSILSLEEKDKIGGYKFTNKEFKKLHAPKIFWDSKNNGTYSYGKNEAKRQKKLKKK